MIQHVHVKNLRGIREGALENLTPLTVLVGVNGSGKSTLLEAMLIGASPVPGDAVGRAVRRRLGLRKGGRWLFWRSGMEGVTSVKITTDAVTSREIDLVLEPYYLETTNTKVTMQVKSNQMLLGEMQVLFEPDNTYTTAPTIHRLDGVPEVRLVQTYVHEAQVPLHALYNQAIEQGRWQQALDILKEVMPGMLDLRLLTEEDYPILHFVFDDRSIPVPLAGDGVQALTRLTLELATRRQGTVLLEEPEVHMHPKALWLCAKAIVAALRKNIQIVLSTHSLELIDDLLSEATDKELAKMSVFRVLLKNGQLLTSRFDGDDIALARSQIQDDLR